MDKLKKVFSSSSKDDKAPSGPYGASENAPAPTDSKPADAPQLVTTDPTAESKSHGVLRQVFNPNGEKYSEQSYGTTAAQAPGNQGSTGVDQTTSATAPAATAGPSTSTTAAQTSSENSSQWRDSTLAGIGAAGAGSGAGGLAASEGIKREDKGDDVSDSTYTARSYQLSSGVAGEPLGPDKTVQPTDTTYAGPPHDSEYIRDGSLAGAGTIIGAGSVGAGDLAAQENKPKDAEVANATYTDRAYAVGGSGSEQPQEGVVPTQDAAKFDNPHVPGEFPTEEGLDPHMPGAFPATPAEEADRGIGSGSTAAVATGVGAGAIGGGILGAGASKSSAQPETTESSAHPGGEGFPIMTPTNSIPHATSPVAPEAEHHYGRDTAIAGGAAAATGAAGYGIYESTRGGDVKGQAASSVPATTTGDRTQAQPPPESEHHYGRDAAVAGGATAATGAVGYGAYEATKGDDAKDQLTQSRDAPQTTTTEPTRTVPETQAQPEHHYGRDAAVAGGATAATGAAGYGVYEATKGDQVQDQAAQEPSITEKIKQKLTKSDPKQTDKTEKTEKTTPSKLTKSEPAKTVPAEAARPADEQPEETHYGRDAAIVGGTGAAAGAAGYGIYEGTRDDPTDTGPASKTIGPHESNVANVVDPRVKPEPEKMKGNEPTTTGLYTADARVQSDPTKAEGTQSEETHYGRDAAIAGGAGGAGVAGAGAYEASKERGTPVKASSRTSSDSPSNNKTSVDERGHTHLHKKSVEQQGEKKPGLVSRILHPNRTKREKEEQEASRRSYEQPTGYDQAQQKSHHVGTDGAIGDDRNVSGEQGAPKGMDEAQQQSQHIGTDGPIGDPRHVSGSEQQQPQTEGDNTLTSTMSRPAAEMPPPEHGYITLTHPNAHPDAPHVVVRDP